MGVTNIINQKMAAMNGQKMAAMNGDERYF
jgi:hypothetical protein